MKVLRSTMYPPSIDEPITIVAAAPSLKVSVEEAAAGMEQPGMFVVSDIFELPDDTQEPRLSVEGMKRQMTCSEDERNMAICYYWNAAQLARMNPGGGLANPSPAPLSVKQLEVVLRQLSKHPNYQKQTVICVSKDRRVVQILGGTISINPLPLPR